MKIPPGYAVTRTAITASTAFATSAAPQYLTGDPVAMGDVQANTLSALCTVDAETSTITITAVWQVSVDGTTYYNVAGTANNAANVPLATGTGGGDAVVTTCVPAPDAIYAYPWARVRLMTGITTADGTNDVGGAVYRYLRAGAYANL
jgi:hypothetical protein